MVSRKEKRLALLRSAILEHSSLHIKDAAELLDVSEMTVRRDIRENPQDFDYFGGHIVQANNHLGRTPYDLGSAAEINDDEKRRACANCLSYIKPKDTIFVDCGSTLVHLVDLLPADIEITLVCFALNIADRAIRKPNVKLVLIGGVYQPATASFSALHANTMFEGMAISTAFMSAAGLDPKLGATCTTFREAIQKRAAMSKSHKHILVVDESKIGKIQPACFGQTNEFDLIVTENGVLEFETV